MRRNSRFVAISLSFLLIGLGVLIKGQITQVPTVTWAAANPMAQARAGAAAVMLSDGRWLVTGGDDGTGPLATVEMFDTAGNFSPAPHLTFARSHHRQLCSPMGACSWQTA